ncbi:MAG: hypothetical protein NW201_08760 [Gemmatimonadales bacterium]|nr:hypothetical protein [Gemmatimonadales bacterium]
MRRRAGLLAALALAAACAGREKPAAADDAAPPAPDAQADADRLGRELFELADRTDSYRATHKRMAKSFRDIGIDSLTPETARRLAVSGKAFRITVEFRQVEGHLLRSCEGDERVIEEAALHEGVFPLECTLLDGTRERRLVGGSKGA